MGTRLVDFKEGDRSLKCIVQPDWDNCLETSNCNHKETASVQQSLTHLFSSVFHLLAPLQGIAKKSSANWERGSFFNLKKCTQRKVLDNIIPNDESHYFSSKARKRQQYLTNFIQHCTRWQCSKGRKIKVTHNGKEGIKVFLFADGMIFYVENLEE